MYYLEFRLWVGVWIGVILLIFVATDASVFVSYITRFTEENFATLIALIFMVEVRELYIYTSIYTSRNVYINFYTIVGREERYDDSKCTHSSSAKITGNELQCQYNGQFYETMGV